MSFFLWKLSRNNRIFLALKGFFGRYFAEFELSLILLETTVQLLIKLKYPVSVTGYPIMSSISTLDLFIQNDKDKEAQGGHSRLQEGS